MDRIFDLGHMGRPIITFTTDFGTEDGYVGAVKGVIRSINPQAEVVDITHQVEPFDVVGAAFALRTFYPYFPKGTVHLAVVDPGVGGDRQALAIQSEDFLFVGPDNGLFSFVYDAEVITAMVSLSNSEYFLAEPSVTFHARDIFAPVAAYLSLGVDINEFGNPAKECSKLLVPQPKMTKGEFTGEVIHIDRFGNLTTNIGADLLHDKQVIAISIGRKQIKRVFKSYNDMPVGLAGALMGSGGFLEIAVNQGNAQAALRAMIGTRVRITFR